MESTGKMPWVGAFSFSKRAYRFHPHSEESVPKHEGPRNLNHLLQTSLPSGNYLCSILYSWLFYLALTAPSDRLFVTF